MASPSVEKLREFALDKEEAVSINEVDPGMEKELEKALEALGFKNDDLDKAFAEYKEKNYLGYPDLLGASTAKKIVEAIDDLAEAEDETATDATTPGDVKGMHISEKGIDMIKHFEGMPMKNGRCTAYKCSAAVPTIAIGTTRYPQGSAVKMGDTCTEEEGYGYFKHDIKKFEDSVKKYIDVPLTQTQMDALVSFCYNCGSGALASSTLRKKLNKKDYDGAAKEFLRWDKANGRKIQGLTRRRVAEKALFEGKNPLA